MDNACSVFHAGGTCPVEDMAAWRKEVLDRLRAPFPIPPSLIKTGGKGKDACYLDRDGVIKVANHLFHRNWGYHAYDLTAVDVVHKEATGEMRKAYTCMLRLHVCGFPDVVETGVGDNPYGLSAVFKGAVTDGLKRAISAYGDAGGLFIMREGFGRQQLQDYAAQYAAHRESVRNGQTNAALSVAEAPSVAEVPSQQPSAAQPNVAPSMAPNGAHRAVGQSAVGQPVARQDAAYPEQPQPAAIQPATIQSATQDARQSAPSGQEQAEAAGSFYRFLQEVERMGRTEKDLSLALGGVEPSAANIKAYMTAHGIQGLKELLEHMQFLWAEVASR